MDFERGIHDMITEQQRESLAKLVSKKKMDIKEWHRAIGLNQWALEGILNNTLDIDEEYFHLIYTMTQEAKKLKLLRFSTPKIIVVWSHKGGTGKSTVASNISYSFAHRGYNVLAIDVDSQSDMSSVLHPDYLNEPEKNFYEAFVMHADFVDNNYIYHTEYDNLDLIAGSGLCENLENTLSPLPVRMRNGIFDMCLKRIKEENYYDFIIIDMDKTAGLLNKAILADANYVISPLECSIFSVKSVPPIVEQIEVVKSNNPKLELLGIIFNKVDLRKKNVPESQQLIEELLPGMALSNYIKNDVNVENSQREHLPLGVYNRSSRANKQIEAVADELLSRIAARMKQEVI